MGIRCVFTRQAAGGPIPLFRRRFGPLSRRFSVPPPRARWVAALVCLLGGAAHAQPPADVRFEVPPPGTLSGRPTFVYDIVQDPTGYLWFASEQGLHRYDGVEFVPYRADPDDPEALPGNRVTSVSVGPDGTVWAGVDRFGLVRLRPGHAPERFPLADSLTVDPYVRVDREGRVWLAHRGWDVLGNGGSPRPALYRFDPASGAARRSRTLAEAWGILLGPDGTLWSRSPEGVLRHGPGGVQAFRVPEGSRLVGGGVIRVITPAGWTFEYDPEREGFRRLQIDPDLTRRHYTGYRLWSDREGVFWAGVFPEGRLIAVGPGSGVETVYETRPTDPESLPGHVTAMYQDREGVYWIGTNRGVRMVRPGWATFRTEPLPPVKVMTVLAPSRRGGVWTGTLCSPPALLTPAGETRTLSELAPAVGAAYARVGHCSSHVLEARDGTFWFAGWPEDRRGGLLRITRDGEATLFRHNPADPGSIPIDAMRMVHEDARGRIWVATEAGLVRHDPATDGFVPYAAPTALDGADERRSIWTVSDGPGEQLWVSAYGLGLSLFDPVTGRETRFRHDPDDPATLSSDNVIGVLAPRRERGVVWVGTYDGGINRLDLASGAVRRYTLKDGLPALGVKSLLDDDQGRIWAATEAGLVRLDPATDEVRVFTEADGLPSTSFGLYDGARLGDDQFAFALIDRVVRFDPLTVEPPGLDAPVVLRGVWVDGEAAGVPAPGQPIRLGPDERALAVEVAALSFRAPGRLRYEVRLDGVDAEWVRLGDQRTASWSRLPPGRHTLHARVGTASGRVSPRSLMVPVVVVPRWWERWQVRSAFALVLLAGLVLAVRDLSQRRLRAEVRRLETERRVQDERERISRDLHDHVGAQLSSLLAGVELAKLARRARGERPGAEVGGGDGSPADPLAAVESDARETIRQLRETIWALNDETLTAGAFCQRLDAYVKGRAKGRIGTLSVTCDGDASVVLPPVVALSLYRVAQEAVTNALKHSGARSLAVRLRPGADAVTLVVEDDGRFVEPAGGDGLSGFGLGSMRTRAQQMGGTFDLDTTSGTRVRVRVPLDGPASPA